MRCVVLAGGPHDEIAALTADAPNKAFVEIRGQTLLERTLRALRASASISTIRIVAPPSAHDLPLMRLADDLVDDGKRIGDSLSAGLAGFDADEIVMVSTSDLPILSASAVDDFVHRALELDADLAYGCVEKQRHLAEYPQVPHTWARMREGSFCGGGAVAIKPRILPALAGFLERLGAARKSPLRLAGIFGWPLLLSYAFGRLSIADAQRRASALLGAPIRALISPFPEFAVNVDRLSDVALAEQLLDSASA